MTDIPPYAFLVEKFDREEEKVSKQIDNTQKLPIDCDSQEVTQFDIQQIDSDDQAKNYFETHGISELHDTFMLANILHTNKKQKKQL